MNTKFRDAGDGQTAARLSFTVAEACSVTGLGRSTIYELISDGQLRAFKAAGRRLILREDLEAYLYRCRDAA